MKSGSILNKQEFIIDMIMLPCHFSWRLTAPKELLLKSPPNLFSNNVHMSYRINLKFCTEHGSDTAVLCAKFQNDLTTEQYVMGKQIF